MDLTAATPVGFVYVSDPDRALNFYQGILGFKLVDPDPYGYFVEVRGALLRITQLPDHKPSEHPVFGFEVGNIAETVSSLRSADVVFSVVSPEAEDNAIWSSPDGGKIAFFSDLDGNVLMLSEKPH
jgi:catechol 2,3-dioxygenase-like lactoylglutathione lyase family enzyme